MTMPRRQLVDVAVTRYPPEVAPHTSIKQRVDHVRRNDARHEPRILAVAPPKTPRQAPPGRRLLCNERRATQGNRHEAERPSCGQRLRRPGHGVIPAAAAPVG